ncbi:MAG TPA: acyltransferase family protein, partial [Terricaulis sp.]|nr:acyltransferase family protein [Terricaulis sp.]
MYTAPMSHGAISGRRADVDALRALALLLLIVYHILLIYTGREFWRVNSSYHGYWADYFLNALTPWRMGLVFFIGGVAVRFMLARAKTMDFIAERASKLLVAFVFAVVVLIPPQRFVRLEEMGYSGKELSYGRYFSENASHVVHAFGLEGPDLAHAWFLPYLFLYSALAALLWRYAPRFVAGAQRALERAPLPVVILGAMALFSFTAAYVFTKIPVSGLIFADFGAHMRFAPVFFLGVLLGRSEVFVQTLNRLKVRLWIATACALALSTALMWLHLHHYIDAPEPWLLVRGAYGAMMLCSMLALGYWALNKPSPFLDYASDAIMPVYLMHQTFLVVVGDVIIRQRLGLALEAALLFAAAIILPLILYQLLVRHFTPLRMLFGLRPKLKQHYPP